MGVGERVVLPAAVKPERYELRLTPDLEKFVFDGELKLHVSVSEPTHDVWLHMKELAVRSARFESASGDKKIELVELRQNFEKSTGQFVFKEQLPVGAGVVHI